MSKVHLMNKQYGYYTAMDKTPIYYETYGEGEPLVLVYGLACLINHWHYQIEHFAKKYKVIVFDLRGHHKSTPVSKIENITLDHLAFDLKGLLNHLGYKTAHFAGHSFGAPYLAYAASQFPEMFQSMTLINGFIKNPLLKIKGFDIAEPFYYFLKAQYEKSPLIVETLWKSLVDNPLALNIMALAGGFNLEFTQYKDVEMYGRGVAHLDLPVFFEYFKYVLYSDSTPLMKNVDTPTLIIAGDRDYITSLEHQEHMQKHIKNSKLVTISKGSHCTILDFPERVNEEMEQFIAENS